LSLADMGARATHRAAGSNRLALTALHKGEQILRHLPDLPFPIFPRARSADGRWLRATMVFGAIDPHLPDGIFTHPVITIWIDRNDGAHRWVEGAGAMEAPWMLSLATFAFPTPGDRRLRAMRFRDLIWTLAPPQPAGAPAVEKPEPFPTPTGPIALTEGRIVWRDPATGSGKVLSPPVPLQATHPLTGSPVLGLGEDGGLWRGDLRGPCWEAVMPASEATREVMGVREGAYGLVLET